MFNTKHNECVGFESRWKVKKVSSDSSTQTTNYSTSQSGTNTLEKAAIEIQTETTESPVSVSETDMEKLGQWLSKIYPQVKREIDNANTSQAFRGYKLVGDDTEANCRLLQTISVLNAIGSGDKVQRVSSISWNHTGNTLAVSCNYEHKSWCYHSGYVLVYTLNSAETIPAVPRKKLSTESCVTNLKFHLTYPAVLAAGTFSGNIYIWNIQNEEEDNVLNINGHEEAVTHLAWINDIDSAKTVLLASSSTDGLLKLWNFNLANFTLNVKARYKIKAPVLGMTRPNQGTAESPTKNLSRGIICFDFSKHVLDMFIVGIEGGRMVQCSVLGASELKGSTKEEPLMDPTFKYYEPHEGDISSVSFSPNRNDMFMTMGSDSEIRIYLIGQEEPAQVIFIKSPLNDLSFVPYEEKLIVGCGTNGILELFNLITGKSIQNITTDKVRKIVLTTLAINNAKANLVVTGNFNGDVQLWHVPWLLLSGNN